MTIDDLKFLCVSEDWEAIEGARDVVGPQHLPEFIAYYWEMQTWARKFAIIQLIQDQNAYEMRPVMLDILRAPDVDTWMQDTVELTKAIALGFIDEKYDRFMTYYNDRTLLRGTVLEVLEAHGLTQEVAPISEKEVVPVVVSTTLLEAIRVGDLDAMRGFLSNGDDPNQYVEEGNTKNCTYLMEALAKEQVGAAWLLLEFGADPDRRRRGGEQSPLAFAASYNHRELCLHLMDQGADPNRTDNWGDSVVKTAAQYGYMELLEDAIARGARVDMAYHDGRNAIWFAADNGETAALERLLEAGEPINELASGSAPLHLASRNNSISMLKMLIKRGADLNLRNEGGSTPLMLAARKGNSSVVSHLLKAGADPDLVDSTGNRAADLATGRRADKVLAVFEENK